MSAGRDGIWLGGIGADVFGEHNAARIGFYDPVNDFLRTKYLSDYIVWHRKNVGFYDDFEKDCWNLKVLGIKKWTYTLGAAAFAAVVINPNFT